jgi:hypothetical protein
MNTIFKVFVYTVILIGKDGSNLQETSAKVWSYCIF